MLELKELAEVIQKNYPCKVLNIKPLHKETYLIEAEDSYFKLMRFKGKPDHINFAQHVVRSVHDSGCKQLAGIQQTVDGQAYFVSNHSGWVLVDWFNGRPIQLANPKDIQLVTRTLAGLHHQFERIVVPHEVKGTKEWTKWPKKIMEDRSFVTTYLQHLAVQEKLTDFEQMVLHMRFELSQMLEEAVRCAHTKSCEQLIRNEAELQSVIYHQLKEEELTFSLDNQIYFINPLKMQYDVRVKDLALWIQRLIKKDQQNTLSRGLLSEVVHWYDEVRPLSRGERDWLLSYLITPHKIIKTIKRYVLRKKAWPEEGFVRKLRKSRLKMQQNRDVYQQLLVVFGDE